MPFENNVKTSLSSLKTELDGDTVLGQYDFKDYFLIRFLYSSNFHIPNALEKIKEYHYLVLHNSKIFIHPRPQDLLNINVKDKIFLNGRDRCGRKVLVVKLGKLNIRTTAMEEQVLLFNLLVEKVIGESLTLQNGLSIIFDVLNVPWKLIQWMTPHNIKMAVKLLENYPLKEIIIHVVNKSYLVQIGVNIVWPFLSEERKEMIKFHFNNWPSLHKEVNPEVLPAEYGGSGPDLIFKEKELLSDAENLTKQIQQNMCLRN
ncbi:hypothetical protein FQR65_LT04277 [Abscondita terminalis]|nr:hypothetical protein FQR65_LT04277 [Abscondita terminalis]